jgi:ankyrin repeat protein
MARGELDVVGVWGPFAGYARTKRDAPIALQPANLMADNVQLEFEITIGVRETDVVLKYALDNALSKSADKIKTILTSFGVPLVECSQCIVTGDLPSHGAYSTGASAYARYLQPLDEDLTHIDRSQAAPHGIVTVQDVTKSLAAGANVDAELAHAVLASDPARIRFLAAHGADLDARDTMGATPLIIAAGARDSATVELLLELGADVNALDGSGWAPLMEAVYRDHVPSVEALLRHGAGLAMTDSGGLTPLCIALDNRSLLAASALVEAGASANAHCGANRLTPLMIVATHLDAEARGNVPVDGGQFLSDGVSPLDVGKLLVSKGADVNARARGGATALMIAAGYDNAPLVGLLIQAGAEIDVRSDDGKTALDIAEDNGSDTAVSTLELMARFAVPKSASAPEMQSSP